MYFYGANVNVNDITLAVCDNDYPISSVNYLHWIVPRGRADTFPTQCLRLGLYLRLRFGVAQCSVHVSTPYCLSYIRLIWANWQI